MELIHQMPVMFGVQFYPMGFPLKPEDINVESVSITKRFLRYGNGTAPLEEDKEVLTNYIRYYLLAPNWKIEVGTDKIFEMNYEELFDMCLDNGLDPF